MCVLVLCHCLSLDEGPASDIITCDGKKIRENVSCHPAIGRSVIELLQALHERLVNSLPMGSRLTVSSQYLWPLGCCESHFL